MCFLVVSIGTVHLLVLCECLDKGPNLVLREMVSCAKHSITFEKCDSCH